ncbi:MAG: hypothetical protein ABFD44_03710 [Anaerolineaceae bacterium]
MRKFVNLIVLLSLCIGILAAGSPVQAAASSDLYGYTWTATSPDSWVEAAGGTKLALDSTSTQPVKINLPFAFPFYGKTYTEAYITRHGYLTFQTSAAYPAEGRLVEPGEPNGVIAGYWSPLLYAGSDGVYTITQGTSPDRIVVIEWSQVKDPYQNTFTFEIILHENGDIRVQFGSMNKNGSGGYYCGRVGIENETGSDGLVYQNCIWPSLNSNTHVRFVYPPVQARAHAYPAFQSAFIAPNETMTFPFNLGNTGNLGADQYTIDVNATWKTLVTNSTGDVLAQNGASGSVGPVAQGAAVSLAAQVQAPAVINYEDVNQSGIRFTSTLDISKTSQVNIQTGVPAAFVQAYADSAQDAVVVEALKPDQRIRQTFPLYGNSASNTAVLERPDKNLVVLWNRSRCVIVGCPYLVHEIVYAVLDNNLQTLRSAAPLINESLYVNQADDEFTAASAPNGDIGILWVHSAPDPQMYFARIDSSGTILGMTSLTPALLSGTYVSKPTLAVSDDNHFVAAWQQSTPDSSGSYYEDIYYAVLSVDGVIIKPTTQLTHDSIAYADSYLYPALGAVGNNQVLITYSYSDTNSSEDLYFQVIGSDGTIVKEQTPITTDGYNIQAKETDIVRLPGGNIFIAWRGFRPITSFEAYNQTCYALLASDFTLMVPRQMIYESDMADAYAVSATQDGVSNAILTWVDGSTYRLYYALIGADGTLRTQPMIIHTSSGNTPAISSSSAGSTSYSLATTPGVDLVSNLPALQLAGGTQNLTSPGTTSGVQSILNQNTIVSFDLHNLGKSAASGVVLDATLDDRLVPDPANMLPMPDATSANTYRWYLPDLKYLGYGEIQIPVTLPGAPGIHYPVTFTLHVQGMPDKSWTVDLVGSSTVYLPFIIK